jgi:zinc protease
MRRLICALVISWVCSPLSAQTSLKEIRQVEGITEYALPNGLVVLLQPDNSKPTTSVNITYRVGSRHEGYGESGAAHLLEHLLFKATDTIADPKLEMTRRGARWNGTTWVDRTNYFAQFSNDSETLDWVLGWLAESMTRAKVDRKDLVSEMTVVRNEMERAENNPGRVLGERMRSVAYQWHGYGRDTLGARSDIENMPIERLQAFYRKHYRPDNAVLVVGGKFDKAAALARIEQAFGPLAKPSTPIENTWTLEPAQDGERQVVLRRAGGASSVAVLYHVMPGSTPDFAAVRVLAQWLRDERGPVDTALVQTGRAATQWAFAMAAHEPGYLMAGLGLPDLPETEAPAAAAQAAEQLAQVLGNLKPTQAQVDLARTQVLQNIQRTLREPEALSLALSESIALGDWRLLFAQRDWVAAVTLEDVQRVAASWLRPANRTTGIYIASATTPLRAPPPLRADVPQLLAQFKGQAAQIPADDFELTAANIEARLVKSRITVGGQPGLQLVVLPRQTKGERVTGTLRLRWGTAESVAGSSVLAGFLGPLLTQGTSQISADQIKKNLSLLDARLSFFSGVSGITANFELPAKNLEALLELVAQLLMQPTLSDAEFERQRTAALASLQVSKADPAALAANALQQSLSDYPAQDPRASLTFAQREQLLRSITAQQLRDFYQRFASASVGELALVGPVQAPALQAQLQQVLGTWSRNEPYRPWVFKYPDNIPANWQTLQLPDKANATYAATLPLAMNDDAPDYPALFVGIQLLGGRAGGTALWKRVREEEGLSYGVNSSLSVPTAGPGEGQAAAIHISASFAPQNRDKLRGVIRDEVAKRAASGFSGLEVGFARRAIVSGMTDSLAQPADLASRLANNLRRNRDMSRFTYFKEAYEKLDADSVNAALRKYLDVSRLVEVAAGTFEK